MDCQITSRKIFKKWDLDFVVIGKTTNSKNITLRYNNKIEGEIPIEALSSKAPIYERKWTKKSFSKNQTLKFTISRINLF